MAKYIISLRQEILDASGKSTKSFEADEYKVGQKDLQMYWFKGADGSSMQVNRNNILSIVTKTQEG